MEHTLQALFDTKKPLLLVVDPMFLTDGAAAGDNTKKLEWLMECWAALKLQGVSCNAFLSGNSIAAKTRLLFPEMGTAKLAASKSDNPYRVTQSNSFLRSVSKAHAAGVVAVVKTMVDFDGEHAGNYSIISQLVNSILRIAGDEPIPSQQALLEKLVDYCNPLPPKIEEKRATLDKTIARSREGFDAETDGLDKVRDAVRKSNLSDDPDVKSFLGKAADFLQHRVGTIHKSNERELETPRQTKAPAQRAKLEKCNRNWAGEVLESAGNAEALLADGGIARDYLMQQHFIPANHPNALLLTPGLIQAVFDSDALKALRVAHTSEEEDVAMSVLPLSHVAVKDAAGYFNDGLKSDAHCVMVTSDRSEFFDALQPALLAAYGDRHMLKVDPAKHEMADVSRYSSLDKLIDRVHAEMREMSKAAGKKSPFAIRIAELEKQYRQFGHTVKPDESDIMPQEPGERDAKRQATDGDLVDVDARFAALRNRISGLNGPMSKVRIALDKGAGAVREEFRRRKINPDAIRAAEENPPIDKIHMGM